MPLIRSFISLPAGIWKMHIGKFLIYTFLGSFIWCTALSLGGYFLGQNWDKIRTVMRPFDPVIVVLAVILIGFYVYRHVKHNRELKKS
jgi:membrane protein DedA with SNARE-associated domain